MTSCNHLQLSSDLPGCRHLSSLQPYLKAKHPHTENHFKKKQLTADAPLPACLSWLMNPDISSPMTSRTNWHCPREPCKSFGPVVRYEDEQFSLSKQKEDRRDFSSQSQKPGRDGGGDRSVVRRQWEGEPG